MLMIADPIQLSGDHDMEVSALAKVMRCVLSGVSAIY